MLVNTLPRDCVTFQRSPGIVIGYDDLKVIEAKRFLAAVMGDKHMNSTIDEAHAVAEVISAAAVSLDSGTWQPVPAVPSAAFRHRTKS